MHHIFLSDVHLGAFHEEKNQQLENSLIELVDHCQEQSIQIHLLGDLFDYWMEYKNYIPPIGEKLLNRFEIYNQQLPATFITGNHDFWTYGHFAKLGFKTETEYVHIELDESSILMFHGDGLTDNIFSLPRPFLNNILRQKWFVDIFQFILRGKTGNHLMKHFSEFTRDEDDINPERLTDWAGNFLSSSEYNVIITGHDHVPRIETFTNGLYINPGAYHMYHSLIYYTNGAFKLVEWKWKNRIFKPFAAEDTHHKKS